MSLPVYEALINATDEGLLAMSLVGSPATEKDWMMFNQETTDKVFHRYSIESEEKQILFSVGMVADTKIYRRDGDFEYYITFSKETLRIMAEKMLFDNTFNNIDLQHDGYILPKGCVSLVEVFIKDIEKGVNPKGFEDIPDGSLFCSYHVNDETLWNLCKSGEFNGFSLEGCFSMKPIEEFSNQHKNSNNFTYMLKQFKEKLASLLMNFGEIVTDNGTIYYEGELTVGVEVQDAEGNALADGDYTTDDKILSVKDGKVSEIKDKEVEEPETPETTEPTEPTEPETTVEAEEETPESEPETEHNDEPTEPQEAPETPEVENRVAELETKVGNLTALVEELKTKLETYLATPEVEPVSESFSKIVSDVKNPSRTHTAMRDALARVRESKK